MDILDSLNLPNRELSAEDGLAINRAARAILLEDARELRDRADRLGMDATALKLSEAVLVANKEL